MKNQLIAFSLLTLLATLNPQLSTLHAQGTTFTYQGRLNDGANAANGSYDLQFAIYDSTNNPGTVVAGPLTNVATPVSHGLFSVTLDFAQGVFTGANRWLEIGVRSNSIGDFTILTARQRITAAPYSITAGNLSGLLPAGQLTGTLPSPQLSGTYSAVLTFSNAANSFAGNGAGLTSLNANNLASGTVPNSSLSNAWKITGNSSTTAGTHFLGTTDNQPLEFKVNGLRALRLENNGDSASDNGSTPDGAPNLVGGSPRNFVGAGVVGATIAGGGATNYGGFAYSNSVLAHFGVVGGGLQNTIAADSLSATIAGGSGNDIGTNAFGSVIGGGGDNTIAAWLATIAGGRLNDIGTSSIYSAIGGGYDNNIAGSGRFATIAGGEANGIGTDSNHSAIGGGGVNNIEADADYATIAGGQVNRIRTNSDYSAIGGGYDNGIAADASHATIAGGYFNRIGTNSDSSAIGGGFNNNIAVDSAYATIPGGDANSATNYAFAAGHRAKANHTGTFVWGDSFDGDVASSTNNQFTVRASGGARFFSNTAQSAGVSLAAGGTAWAVISDRNVKKNFRPVNSREVLERLAALPVTRWNYQWEADDGVPHLGPMAQDFKAAFYPGADDKSITTQEADGVALAAIQGLNQKLDDTRAELECRKLENAELKQRLEKLERLIDGRNEQIR